MKLKKFIFHFKERYNIARKVVLNLTGSLMLLLGFLGILGMIYITGFDLSQPVKLKINIFFEFVIEAIFTLLLLKILLGGLYKHKWYVFVAEVCLFITIGLIAFEKYFFPNWLEANIPSLNYLKNNIFVYAIILLIFIIEISRQSLFLFFNRFNPASLFVISFIFLIFCGTGLLMLPNASVNGISFVDALFTSTSAVCVTGLITVDTATAFTSFGKGIIMALFQIGGLGVMTFTSFFGLFFTGNMSFKSSLFVKDMINSEVLSDIFKNLLKIVIFIFVIEILGALIIYLSINDSCFGSTAASLRFSVFHSISAFCNAGFSTLSAGLYDESIRYNYLLHLIVALLIILGGMGFPVMLNYYKLLKHFSVNLFRKLKGKSYIHKPNIININTRIVIYTTVILLAGGTLIYYFSESNNAFREHSFAGKIIGAFFASATARTAGFNTIDYGNIVPLTLLTTIFLMWVGASPASMGGGIKTSSFAIAFLNVINFARGRNRIEIWGREIADSSVRKAFAAILLSLLVIGISVTVISTIEPELSMRKIFFECFSAFSTVGLSMGITPSLSEASKIVLVLTMFLGRVGTLTIFVIFVRKVLFVRYKYPEENIIIT